MKDNHLPKPPFKSDPWADLPHEKGKQPLGMGLDAAKALSRKVRFGDILLNHWAGHPEYKVSIFIKRTTLQGSRCFYMRDAGGNFSYLSNDAQSRTEIIGSIFDEKKGGQDEV